MFHKTSLRLAGLYLAIMMIISLFFSVNVYRLSTQELDRSYENQEEVLERLPAVGIYATLRDQTLSRRRRDIDEAKSRIVAHLVLTNLLILVIGGGLSYYLARRSLQPIEDAHEAQSRFTADASHELRTPLAVMQTENEVTLMKPKLKLAEAKEQLQSNLEELHKLNKLTDGLLHLSRLDHAVITASSLPLNQIVNSAITRILPAAEAKHILINSLQADNLQVHGDEASLIELLVIVLDNAIKYSPVKSEIKLITAKDSHFAEVKISDHGIGIKPGEIEHIFERFYRADSARNKQRDNGYGLGLAIAKNIVDLHHGSIFVKSRAGQGTTFIIRLPLAAKLSSLSA